MVSIAPWHVTKPTLTRRLWPLSRLSKQGSLNTQPFLTCTSRTAFTFRWRQHTVGIFRNFFQRMAQLFQPVQTPSVTPEPNAALVELVAVYKGIISELRVGNESLKGIISERDAQIIELRKQVELIPVMTVKPQAENSIYEFNADLLNDQPSYSADGDLKQIQEADKAWLITQAEFEKELVAIATEASS
jgi:hypothetical protein